MSEESWSDPAESSGSSALDSLCVQNFWSEPETPVRGSQTAEEADQDALWLQEAGFSPLVDPADSRGSSEAEPVDELVLLSTLTRTQAAAVQRRLHSYTRSLRQRNRTPPPHIRDVFHSAIAQSAAPEAADSEADPRSNMETSAPPPAVLQMEEIFTDVSYCEQAVALLKQDKRPLISAQRRRDEAQLPRVVCARCRLGVTKVSDLSAVDLKKVRSLALIDLTALSDFLGLQPKRLKTGKKMAHESCLFGVPLASLLESDQKIKPGAQIPLFLNAMLSLLEKKGLDSEGILRVPGSQARVKSLQQQLERSFYSGTFCWDGVCVKDAAALLKKFIRELPEPLLTAEHTQAFTAVTDVSDLKQKLHMLNLLVLLLPEPNRSTLKALLEFLSKVVQGEHRNRMSLGAVSTIMAPNLFHTHTLQQSPERERSRAERAADTMRLLIRYQELLWTVPNFLLTQVRKLNENSRRRSQFYDKRIRHLLRKIQTERCSREKHLKLSSESRTVQIQLAERCFSIEFHVRVDSRASDLISQFHREFNHLERSRGLSPRNSSAVLPDCALYEVGGNIGEHRLDPEAHLLDLLNINPGGEWVIKRRSSSRGR